MKYGLPLKKLNWQILKNGKRLINEYLIALFENILLDETENAKMEFQDYFSTISHFYPKFADLINVWKNSSEKSATKHLVNLILREETTLFARKKISGFHDKKENANELISWILSTEMLEYIQSKFFEYQNDEFSEKHLGLNK